jgi:hypothetical protein
VPRPKLILAPTRKLVVAVALALSACGGRAVIDGSTGTSSNGGVSAGGATGIGVSGGNAAGASVGEASAGTGGGGLMILDAGASFAGSSAFDNALACVNANLCSLTPADLACNIDSDCTLIEAPGCGDFSVIGVNRISKATCVVPPCAPTQSDAGCPNCNVYLGEDCSQVQTIKDLSVSCVGHVCRSYYPCPTCLN